MTARRLSSAVAIRRSAELSGLGGLVPSPDGKATGLTVALATSLGMFPPSVMPRVILVGEDSHADYRRARKGSTRLHPHRAETWWLAFKWLERQGPVDEQGFMSQVRDAMRLVSSSRARLTAAWNEQKLRRLGL